MFEVITCDKVIATYRESYNAMRHASDLSLHNRNVSVYVKGGAHFRACYRNGYSI